MSTPQHHIIKDTTATMSRLLQDELRKSGYKRVNIIDQAPKPDAIEGKLPAVSVYLYQLVVDPDAFPSGPTSEVIEVQQADGSKREMMRRRRTWVRLDYLVSAWAQTPEDEQILLGLVIRILADNVSMPRAMLRGDSFDDDFELEVILSGGRLDEGTLSRFWGALNQPIRPSVQVYTHVPIIPETMSGFERVRERIIDFRNGQAPNGGLERFPSPDPRSIAGKALAEKANPPPTKQGGKR